MSDYTITEEPLDAPVVQDEDLTKKSPAQRIRYDSLKFLILETEASLFRMKRQLASMNRLSHRKIVIPRPSPYNCSTCFNDRCTHWLGKKNPNLVFTIVQNITNDVGCLSWLPEV